MKRIYTICAVLLMTASVFAQAPEKMSYQAVVRDGSNNLVTSTAVGMQISILEGSASGTAVYIETQTPTTNANGLVSIEIGGGTVVSGNFSTIDWANGPYFIKTEIDPTGGTSYTITGTSELLSVPYALHSKTAESISGGITETDPIYSSSQAANIDATDITNLSNLSGTNTGDQDISGIAINTQAIQDTATQIRADFPDVSGFISTETDPVYGSSVASGITGTDTTNWNNKLDTETDPVFGAWDKDYNDLINTPNIIDSVTTVIDTTSKFIRVPNNLEIGDILVYDGSQFNRLAKGVNNQVLTMQDGFPTWMYKANISDSVYTVSLNSSDEDYINFGTFENFTNSSDWCVIEKIKMPTGAGSENGWHFFRGKAWEDKEGDIAISISSSQVHAWCQKGGWQNVTYSTTLNEEQWYTICFQYNSSTQTLELYLDGNLVGQKSSVSPMDDSGNTNKLFWGGQNVDPSQGEGDLYSETSIIIAHQALLQRILTPTEIQNYNGYIAPEPALFFSTEINSNSVSDISGNGHIGTNGNTPEYLMDLP